MRRLLDPRVLLIGLLFMINTEALPCECVGGTPLGREGLPAWSAVFLGYVTNIRLLTSKDPVRGNESTFDEQAEVTFRVHRAWKGVDRQTVSVLTATHAPVSCGYPFEVGQYYLVYARLPADGHVMETSLCTPTKELSQAGNEIAALGAPAFEAETGSGSSATFVAGAGASSPGSAEVDADPNDHSTDELETITPGASHAVSVGCSKVDIPFSGRVLTRAASSGKQPVAGARFSVVSGDPTVSADVEVGPDGAFTGSVCVRDEHYYIKSRSEREGHDYRPGYAHLKVEADGCESKIIKVDRRWNSKDITLKCR